MAFDGITTAAVVRELDSLLAGGGISRIIQPEKDELLITVKSSKKQYYLEMSANASLPLIYLTDVKKEAPMSAPNFCMLLRKHIQGGQIISVEQPSLERVVIISIRHYDELGDLRTKKLIIELMGKHSNIIFTDDSNCIIDSIKRIPSSVSSVREVLPGRTWFIPGSDTKTDPLFIGPEEFREKLLSCSGDIIRALYGAFTGISPAAAEEFVFEAGIEPRASFAELSDHDRTALTEVFLSRMSDIRSGRFEPNIIYEGDLPHEFGCFEYQMFRHPPYSVRKMDSASSMISSYYGEKEKITRIRQKSADLRRITQTALDRTNKKYILQKKQQADTEKRDKYRIYGEMLNTYGYSLEEGAKVLNCVNYYTGDEISVPVDPTLTAAANAQKYFARYNKLKRTAEALAVQLEETENDREQLESILTAIELSETESDLGEIRRELADFGFAQKKGPSKKGAKRPVKALPYSFTSSDGFEILVGKNNYQNEELSFKIAGNSDWWFHAKGIPGSHVIVKTNGAKLPDRTFEEAAQLAAYFSSGKNAPKVEIDYTKKKELRKKNGGKPGFVTYHTNYSMMAVPDISKIKRNR